MPENFRGRAVGGWPALAALIALCVAHGLAIWTGLGGRAGLTNGWPIARDDHTLYFHSALVTRAFLKRSWTTAGYDPSFMAGHAKSVVYPASSTLPELVVAAFGGARPELAYKIYVLLAAAAVPWLLALSCALWGARAWGALVAAALALIYIWTDFPIEYATFGMLPYFLGVPLGLLATALFSRYLERGGFRHWLLAAAAMSAAVLVHLTTAMLIAPAALIAYAVAWSRGRARRRETTGSGDRNGNAVSPDGKMAEALGNSDTETLDLEMVEDVEDPWTARRHWGVWAAPLVVLGLNAFWWLPGLCLASTKGPSDFAFYHPEGAVARLGKIVWGPEPPIQAILLVLGVPGLIATARRRPIAGAALSGFCVAGLGWGYLAGAVRALDFLQPGRHTYALFLGLAVGAGLGAQSLARGLRSHGRAERRRGLACWAIAGAIAIVVRSCGAPLAGSLRFHLWAGEPFLSSRPTHRLRWVIDRVQRHVRPGERLLYEESGKDLPGVPDPFQRGRFSGLLPYYAGVEVIGGPYLHVSLRTNFTQFGEGKLFGKPDWGREDFVRYARLYRPAAIVCWSPRARRFCKSNPDLVRILDEEGPLLIGRVLGPEGTAIRGSARVDAGPGRLTARDLAPGVDGTIVLRYHFVPCLTTLPTVACEPEWFENDPVPFIRLRPPPGTREVEIALSPCGCVWPGPGGPG